MPDSVLQPHLPRRSPRPRPDTCRMFENDFLERFSRIHPATPFVVWIPIALFVLVRAAFVWHVGVVSLTGLFLGGIFTWTLAEYILHRFVFHWTNDTRWGKRVHFLLHGVHHEFPSDKD